MRSPSEGSQAPLLTRNEGIRPSSAMSFHSEVYAGPGQTYMVAPSPRSPRGHRPLPDPRDPLRSTPPPTSGSTTPLTNNIVPRPKSFAPSPVGFTGNQMTNVGSRPSYFPQPSAVPRPEVHRSRSREAPDLRLTLLTRLASTRSSKRSRSVDAVDEPESPKSVYSQLSAPHEDYYRPPMHFTTIFENASQAPPLPNLPSQYQGQNFGTSGWRMDSVHDTLPPPPPSKSRDPRPPSLLEESITFPLPLTDDHELDSGRPNVQWFSNLLATESDVVSIRSSEATCSVPHYSTPSSPKEEHRGAIGYQFPAGWRAA